MATMTPTDVRQSIATHLAGLAGWRESAFPADIYGRSPNSLAHQTFAVGVESSTPVTDRQKYTDGVLTASVIFLRYGWRLAPKALIAGYDAAMSGGSDLIKRVMTRSSVDPIWPGSLKPILSTFVVKVDDNGEWATGEVRFEVGHLMPLS